MVGRREIDTRRPRLYMREDKKIRFEDEFGWIKAELTAEGVIFVVSQEVPLAAIECEDLARWLERAARRQRSASTGTPEPSPHSDATTTVVIARARTLFREKFGDLRRCAAFSEAERKWLDLVEASFVRGYSAGRLDAARHGLDQLLAEFGPLAAVGGRAADARTAMP